MLAPQAALTFAAARSALPRWASSFRRTLCSIGLGLALAGGAMETVSAATVYDNTSTDTFRTYLFSVLGTDGIGDVITLAGSERQVTGFSVQFYALSGSGGTFDSTLELFGFTAPGTFGPPLGSATTVGTGIGLGEIVTVSYSFADLVVPDTLAFLVSVSNVTSGLDLGLNAFQPPSIGSSDSTNFVLRLTGGSPQLIDSDPGLGNLYASVTAVPEPSTVALMLAGLAVVAVARRRGAQQP